jgi:cell surface protein SprA
VLNLNKYILAATLSCVTLYTWVSFGKPSNSTFTLRTSAPPGDSIEDKKDNKKRPTYTPRDREGDPFSNKSSNSPFLLKNPSNVQTQVELDSSMNEYNIYEKVGDFEYRPPSSMTFEEYSRYRQKEMMKSYWKSKAQGLDGETPVTSRGNLIPQIYVRGLEGPFGSNFVDIRPNGLVMLDFGGKWQRVNNPNIPVRQQRTGGFDFDQQISMNVVGKIGEKLKLTANWDTKATFDFQNNLKLEYTGFEEDIIQKIEAGTVSFPLNSTLMQGPQNLFGVKTKLQFGRLSVTSVFSSQRGKSEEIRLQGGSQAREINIKADNYEDRRHFFLGQFFRNNYESSLASLPVLNSGVKITRVDVYVTNRANNTQNLRSVVGYLDLGESTPYNKSLQGNPNNKAASNESNNLYNKVRSYRTSDNLESNLISQDLTKGTDYEVIKSARKLLPTDFKFQPDLGYITLNTQIQEDAAIAVAFEYTYQGKTYKVGEMSEDITNVTGDSLIILKLIKPSATKTRLPTWDLMMKNIYQVGGTQLTRDNFQLRVIYKNDYSGLDLPVLQEGSIASGKTILRMTGLDRLNMNNDPIADGNFDYVEDVTIDSKYGRIIFPVLEPFGENMAKYFDPATEQNLINKYVFTELYDSTQRDAMLVASKNKYYLKGRYQSTATNSVQLPGINIAQGSLIVTAGSVPLVQDVDYTVDAQGRVTIINEGILASNQEIKIRYEKQDIFNFRRKSFFGTRFDYKINDDFLLGATILHQNETPNITRVSIGDEPSKNTMLGFDANFKKDSRILTKAVDLLPGIQTKAPSTITASGEVAQLIPGHSRAVSKNGGTAYIDDFEGAKTSIDLTTSWSRWKLGATPKRFPQSNSTTTEYTYGRAKLAWYNIDNVFYRNSGVGVPKGLEEHIQNHFVRIVRPQEIFPNQDRQVYTLNQVTFDLAYFPSERGPYNFNPNLNASGELPNPSKNWGAITRDIRNEIDFDNANIQYIEFWMMDPFMSGTNPNSPKSKVPVYLDDSKNQRVTSGGQLFFNLGSISEDIMKDGQHAFENGLPTSDDEMADGVKENQWGRVTTRTFLTNAFDTDPNTRSRQDVGLDGLDNASEEIYFNDFITKVMSIPGLTEEAKNKILADPSGDNFRHYLGKDNDAEGLSVLQRYKNFNGMENNSPVSAGENNFTQSNSTLPDNEDLNADNTINDIDEYYEYKININENDFVIGRNHIVDKVTGDSGVTWYQFRIPIREPDSIVGNISGFKTIKFMRMYVTGFSQPVVMRFVKLQLVASQWRAFNEPLYENTGEFLEPSVTPVNISTVSIEENGKVEGNKIPYVLPPGFSRDQDATAQNNRRLNEQSLRICAEDIPDKKAGAAYKIVNLDLLNYKNLRMFIHAESDDINTKDGELEAFIRLGTDFKENYYEVAIPLFLTPQGSRDVYQIWRTENELDLRIADLVDVKVLGDKAGRIMSSPFSERVNGRVITVVGRPDISSVQTIMIGIRNPYSKDGQPKSACIWVNELRATNFQESPGWAATARANVKLADLATVSGSLRYTSVGFGTLEQKVSQRERNNTLQWGIQSNISLDKFLPQKLGIRLPLFVGYDREVVSPKYDPLDPDVLLKTSLTRFSSDDRDAYRNIVLTQTTRRAINLTNIQKVKTKKDAKSHLWDVENLSLTVGYSDTRRTSSTVQDSTIKNYKVGLGYNYSSQAKPFEPFKKVKAFDKKYLKLIKDINFNFIPSTISFRGDLDRRTKTTVFYEASPIYGILSDPYYEKMFTFNRVYGLVWNFTKSLSIDYSATAYAVVDESPDAAPDSKENQQYIWNNLKNFGRMKDYNQSLGANYKVPFDKLPITDWISADLRYTAGYTWNSGALFQRDTLGNSIRNERTIGVNGRVNLEKIYNRVKFLKELNSPPPKKLPKPDIKKDTTQKLPKPELKGLKAVTKAAISIKTINFTYNLTQGILVPGYMKIPAFFGIGNGVSAQSMLPFVLGDQDLQRFKKEFAENGYITKNAYFRNVTTPLTQVKTETFNVRTALEPVKDFRIQVEASRTKASDYKEFFRIDSLPNSSDFVSDNPYRNGRYEVTFISIATAFQGKGSGGRYSSKTFDQFVENRRIIFARHKYANPSDTAYSLNSQDVLIPAFISAYSGRDASKISLSSLPKIPLPNWRIDFSGLTRIDKIKKLFPSIIISHGYTSKYSVSSFTSSLAYGSNEINPNSDIENAPPSSIIDGKLVPVYVIDQVVIQETFAPLIGINIRTKGKLTYKVEYRKDRRLALSMSNSQIQENSKNDLVLGIGVAKTGFKFPFRWQGREIPPLKNELNVKLDVTVSDMKTVQREIGVPAVVTNGNLNFQLRPTISYVVNTRVNLLFYFERTINSPRISSSYRRATTSFGVQLRFTLS